MKCRAAMMGADAVVDLQEEFLPDFRRTVRHVTGTAVRAVDADGRFEFRSRWYAARIAWVSKWTLLLLLINLSLTVLSVVFLIFLNQGRLWMMIFGTPAAPLSSEAVAANQLQQVVQFVPVIVAIHAWPVVLAALTRWLRWPQLVRPLALTLAFFALRPVYLLTGLVAAAFWSGGWSALAYNSIFLLDPFNFAMLVFGLFLGRAAWRADREFRRLVPDAPRESPAHRTLVGALTLAVSVIFAALMACYIICAGYLEASQFRLPTPLYRRAGDLAGAEAVYRRALWSARALPGGQSLTPALQASRDQYQATSRNHLARLFALAPRQRPELVREAVSLAGQATELQPDNASLWNTLALARYRARDWPGALAAIERSMRLRNGGDANDWLILAMIRWREGDRAVARRWYDQAATEIKRKGSTDHDLLRLRDEASGLVESSSIKQ